MPPLAPRPFVQVARRTYRLGLPVPRGYAGSIDSTPWYATKRRKPVHQQCRSRRAELWLARLRRARFAAVPAAAFLRCEVA